MVDDKAENYQRIGCTGGYFCHTHSFHPEIHAHSYSIVPYFYVSIDTSTGKSMINVGCHFITRSLCELLYNCGSKTLNQEYRPVPCECVLEYGYGEPDLPSTDTSMTFTEKCKALLPKS